METVAEPPKRSTKKTHTSINFDPHVFDYIERLQKRPEFRRASRSAVVNHLLEELADLKGTPIIPEED